VKLDERDQSAAMGRGEMCRFAALYDEYGGRIYRFCHRLCRNAADAEDLTQEVFVAAFQGLDGFEGRSSVATWLYRIALYRWRKMSHARGPETVPLDDEWAAAATSPDPARAGMTRMSLQSALAALPDSVREAFLLVKAEGLKCREAAAVLGIPEGTLKYRVHQAVILLRALLDEEAAEEPARHAVSPTRTKEVVNGV
jgi:RNA polymerase sigma-70 factor (ECF subfamily)